MRQYIRLIPAFLSLFCCIKLQAQLQVTDSLTAQQLAEILVGQGVVMMNPTMNGTCPGWASGKFNFNGVVSDIGIDSGIVLTSGTVDDQPGTLGSPGVANPATAFSSMPFPAGSGIFAPGDPDLDVLLASFGSSSTTNDACVLEFDFIPAGDTVKFDYVFGSDEYPGFACTSFNDVFGFFISGPGITGTPSIAIVPGTDIPVAINSINNNPNPSAPCTSMGPGSPFSMYYVDNQANGGQQISYDGFTTVLTAKSSVIPCDTYHLKLAIADAGDAAYDSGVFLRSGSLNSIGITLTPESTDGGNDPNAHCIRGCKSASVRFARPTPLPTPLTIKYLIEGTATPGLDYEPILDSVVIPANALEAFVEIKPLLVGAATGPVDVVLKALSPYNCGTNNIIDSAQVTIYDSLYVDILTPDTTVCPNTEITIKATIDSTLNYEWHPAALIPDPPPLGLTIHPKPTVSTQYTITATQPGAPATCPPAKATYKATVEPIPQMSFSKDTTICLRDSVDLNVLIEPEDIDYEITWSPATNLRDDFSMPNRFFAPPGNYSYTITAATPIAHCSNSDVMNITVIPPFTFDAVYPTDTAIKYGDEIRLTSVSDAILWMWSPITFLDDPTLESPVASPTRPIEYTLVGYNEFGCSDTALVKIDVVYNSKVGMPNAFSPNGDGLNDYFGIANVRYEKLLAFFIYNRWGQQIFDGVHSGKEEWDGNIDGQPAAADSYFYLIEIVLPDGTRKTFKGDLVLIR